VHVYNRSLQLVHGKCLSEYGFASDPEKSIRDNIHSRLSSTPYNEFFDRPRNLACHLIGNSHGLVSQADLSLLGRGLNYCTHTADFNPNLIDFSRFVKEARTRFIFAGSADGTYDKKLYLQSRNWNPKRASMPIETAFDQFEANVKDIATKFARSPGPHSRPNLRPKERLRLSALRTDPSVIITATDKNLGPVVIDTETYIDRALQDHLLNGSNYKQLTEQEAAEEKQTIFKNCLSLTVDDFKTFPGKSKIRKYFTRAYCYERNDTGRVILPSDMGFSKFYILPKIHKTPFKTRPVVSQCGSVPEPLSKYLDRELQRVVHLCPSYLKDSWDLLESLKSLGSLPPNALFFTADAVSMYSNIDTPLGLLSMQNWFNLHSHELPRDFPVATIIRGLDLIMNSNVFEFGDTWWKQLAGTAMGTSVACMYATIFYSYHEETCLLLPTTVKYRILFYKRFIDDAIVIILKLADFQPFMQDMNDYGPEGRRLEWEATTPSRQVDFLDLTIAIQPDGSITTKIYQKPMNLYLYLPPTSAHPPCTFRSIIYGAIRRYRLATTEDSDFQEIVGLFFKRMLDRGHSRSILTKWFTEAASRLDSLRSMQLRQQNTAPAATRRNQIFLHSRFHPATPPRRDLQVAFQQAFEEAFTQERNVDGYTIGINRLTIAYSRAPNIRDMVSCSKLKQDPIARSDLLVSQRTLHQLSASDNTTAIDIVDS
jgi:hypothetical protein